jgi:glycerol uptake facilitator-like aquaporin
VQPAIANAWSDGAPPSPLVVQSPVSAAAARNDGSPLCAPGVSSPSKVPPTASALDASNVVHVPAVAENLTHAKSDGSFADTSTKPPTSTTRPTDALSKQSSAYLTTPSFGMTAWRGAEESDGHRSNADNIFGYSRNGSQMFDPTEVPALRHTMTITVTRDGKIVQEELDPYEVARLYGQQQAALRSLQSRYDFLAVPDWVRLHPLLGTYLAELVGSFAWVLTLALVSVRNKSIFTVADDTNMTAIPIGFMFTSMIFTFGYISSAHLNPAVSLSVFLVRQMTLSQCFMYILCQLGGAFLAGVVSMVIQGNTDIFVPSVSSSYIRSGIFSELIFTFAICLVVLNIAYSRQSGNFFYGFAVGMTITAGSASVGRISGGAFNPAAATGLQVAMCIVSNCDDLKSVWIYWLAPLIGAVAAALLFSQMMQPTDTQVLEDTKVFQDVNLLQKQRLAARAAAAGGAATTGEHSSDQEESHSHTSSSSSGQPATPTSSSSRESDAGGFQELNDVSHTWSTRTKLVRSREEVEKEEEVNNNAAAFLPVRGSPTCVIAPASTSATPAPTEGSKTPAVQNNSDVDNWRKRPPPRRDDDEEAAASTHTGPSSWF